MGRQSGSFSLSVCERGFLGCFIFLFRVIILLLQRSERGEGKQRRGEAVGRMAIQGEETGGERKSERKPKRKSRASIDHLKGNQMRKSRCFFFVSSRLVFSSLDMQKKRLGPPLANGNHIMHPSTLSRKSTRHTFPLPSTLEPSVCLSSQNEIYPCMCVALA
mmetsp:Transcript_21737/g.43208  ORF Transcript_21737/g.43208 Transcript_21737/m.43208 type:complete len:162 (-) Transcript_21737:92-577(-)